MVKEGEHRHEEGEPTESCPNCELGRLVGGLTAFERFCFLWYRTNVNQFTFDAHLVGELVRELDLKKATKTIFFKATNLIYQNDLKISVEKSKEKTGK